MNEKRVKVVSSSSVDLGAHNKYLTGHAMSKNSIGKIANAHHHDQSWDRYSKVTKVTRYFIVTLSLL